MTKEMLINIVEGQECRIAIVEDGELEELYVERASQRQPRRQHLQGPRSPTSSRPSRRPSSTSAWPRTASCTSPTCTRSISPRATKAAEPVGQEARPPRPPAHPGVPPPRAGGHRPDHQGGHRHQGPDADDVPVASPAGYLVLMPGMSRLGVSRKIEDEDARAQGLRGILDELNPPPDMGFIVRTAGHGPPKRDLQRDLNYLLRLWKVGRAADQDRQGPGRAVPARPTWSSAPSATCTTPTSRGSSATTEPWPRKVEEFLNVAMPRSKHAVELYTGNGAAVPQVRPGGARSRRSTPAACALPSGGTLVIDQTEALVAIDVNTGRFREHRRRRDDRLPDQPGGRRGDRPPAPPARPGRRDHHRLHRHARGAAPPRRSRRPCATPQERPGQDQGAARSAASASSR